MTRKMPDDQRRELAQLVGPAGPELGCDECFDVLDTYVELELAGVAADAEMPMMSTHLQGCSACREDHDSLLAFLTGPKGSQ